MTSHPRKGRSQGHVTHFRILHPLKYVCNGYNRNFKFCIRVGHVISLVMTDYPSSGRDQSHMSHFYVFLAQAISLERMKLDTSNLVCRLNVKSNGITDVKVLQFGGCIYGHMTAYNFGK